VRMLTPALVALFLIAMGLATLAYGHFVEPGWLRVRTRIVRIPGWPESSDGLRILQLSDLHVGRANHLLVRFMRRAAAIPADVVVITGDFVDRPEHVGQLADVLAPLMSGGRPVVGILGNHDRYVYRQLHIPHGIADPFDADTLIKAIREAGLRLLIDEATDIATACGPVTIAGVDITSHTDAGVATALAGADLERTILLAHSPDARFAAARAGVRLLLAGHTHGGQVRLGPWITLTTSTRHPLKPPSGMHTLEGLQMHVSPGLGTTMLRLRLFSRPEATVIEIRRGG
jgi:predicted MPP superfamily phosphohydrolase